MGLSPKYWHTQPVAPNQAYTVFGAAWAGEIEVTEVSVSTDSGQTWSQAEFVDDVQRYAWRRWKFDWITPKEPGNTPCSLAQKIPMATFSQTSTDTGDQGGGHN
jgi:hypothetical protein